MTPEQIKEAAQKIEQLLEEANRLQQEANRISKKSGVPYEILYNKYLPQKYNALKQQFEALENHTEQEEWIEKHGFNPEDFYSEYGYPGWQNSYC